MAATRLIVLFNLKPGRSLKDYEHWALTTDLPTVKALRSIADFSVYRFSGMLGSDATPPYQYIEIIDIKDMESFGKDVQSETMTRVAAEFQTWADPVFLVTEPVGA
ncbi:hypothetical protein OU995_20750 [Roseateles sp. SL47]|uniref:hypothetical protein n=1 Tax=Roseateles sp. SL47 TaxID=2995138 RepID=UPI00226FA3E2|nr:hypothetical protein [Roseateles sp. SL47]WAC71985.1 hypothetical protein OU995_20750 [Roseateles sp. SL47]